MEKYPLIKPMEPIESIEVCFSKYKTFKEVEIVSRIIDIFEEVLNKNNIYIPDDNRTGSEDEACIYGETYYEIEDKVLEVLRDYNKGE